MAHSRAGLVGVMAALITVAVIAANVSRAADDRVLCGEERWTVKTLQDRPVLRPARLTTVHFLVTRPAPASLPDTRLPFERNVFTVTAAVVLVRAEDDGDFHVILHAGRDQMITETPSPTCTGGATPRRRNQMTRARRLVRVCARARVTGVAFFDIPHGQTGVAPNAIELHPLLAFRCLSGAGTTPGAGAAAATTRGGGGSAAKKCEPGYSPCLPIVADLNCSDIPDSLKPIRVTGRDPYRLDGDGDGYGCESG
jgi:hypothetical protein